MKIEPDSKHVPESGFPSGQGPANAARDFRWFVLRFAVYLIVGNVLLLLPPVKDGFVTPWTALNAQWAVGLSRWFGGDFEASGIVVNVGGGSVAVKPGCNGVHALVLCLAAILAFPAAGSRRAIGLALATVGVFGLNLVRLVNLFFVAERFPEHLEFFHVYIWQTLIALLAFGIFLLWGRFLASDAHEAPAARGG